MPETISAVSSPDKTVVAAIYCNVSPLDASFTAANNEIYFSFVVKFLIVGILSKYLSSRPSSNVSPTILYPFTISLTVPVIALCAIILPS